MDYGITITNSLSAIDDAPFHRNNIRKKEVSRLLDFDEFLKSDSNNNQSPSAHDSDDDGQTGESVKM